jgi:DNA polymerase III subunit alpha
MSFVHLHVHSHFSLLDSTIQIEDLVDAAAADKMTALALTDHGNMFAALEFYSQAKSRGIKPILGCELYLAPGSRLLRGNTTSGDEEAAPYATSRSGLSHVVLLCQNEIGYLNLCKLVSLGYLEGFYYKPRIDKEILAKYSEGLIATSACLKGEITNLVLIGDMDRAKEALKWYMSVFPGRFYLELQQNGIPQQMLVNQRFQELSHEMGVPLVATADCHYLKKEDAFYQEVLLSIQTGRTIEDPSGSNLKTDEYYFKPQAVMEEEFSFCPEAIANTLKIADQCNFDFKFTDQSGKKIYHYPKFDPPGGKTAAEYLVEQANQGLITRLKELEEYHKKTFSEEEKKKYQERLDRELKVINDMGFTGYFLIVSDFIIYAKDHGIPVGPGRGSGAGSLAAYSLRITDLDPLEHGLLFERFLNPERVSLPDFDVDFCMDKRDQVIRYVVEKYGKECVAQIATFGKLQAKGVIRDVGRAFGMLPTDTDRIAKLIPDQLNITLEGAFAQEQRLRDLEEKDPQMHRLFETCRKLEGLARHASLHAAGIVISNRPMVEHCPLFKGKNDELVVQFDMNNADKVGLIKFDFLGLKTLTFLERAERLVQQGHPDANFRLSQINLNDKKMFEMISKGDTNGIFQLESSGMQEMLKKARPDRFADIVALTSLYRPGPMEMIDDFVDRKHGQVPVEYEFEALRPVLQETYGVMVYQEQVQRIAMVLASYTAGGADLLRRAMGKKKPEEMAKQREIFLDGAKKNNFDETKAGKVFDLMEKFAGYGFNKSHAAAYTVVTCQTAFLKCHYQSEFYAALLSIERENTDKITKYIADAQRHGISVLQPDINESETDFTILSNNVIRFGLGAIKGVGQLAIDCILEARKKDGPFKDIFDLAVRCSSRTVNKRVLEALVKGGALDCFKIHRASQFKAIDTALEMGTSLQKSIDENQHDFTELLGLDESQDLGLTQRQVTYPDEPKWQRLQELKFEKDVTGFYMTGHPLDDFKKELERYTTLNISELFSYSSSKEVLLGASIASLREIITKRGDRMAFATLEDKTGQIDTVIFSDAYLENEGTWKSSEPVWVKATLEVQEGNHKLILSKKSNSRVLPLRYAFEALGREMHIYFSPAEASIKPEKLRELQNHLKAKVAPNGCPVFLHLNYEGKADTVLRLRETVPLVRDTVLFIESLWNEEKATIEFR